MKYAIKQTGFSLIELMVVLAITSILTTLSVISYRHIQNKIYLNQAKQSLFEAAKQYHFYQLVNPYLLNDLSSNITFENNNDYHFQLEQKQKTVTFIAIQKHPSPQDHCTKLSLNTRNETNALNANGQEASNCWQ
jgi:prepilin-type N-terminal cleavage/methylation domain-containing protein